VLGWFATLAVVWAMTNPPFAAPDEANHYLRAVGVGDGSLVGARARLAGPRLDLKLVLPSEPTAAQLAWVNQAARAVTVPPGLSPEGFDCELRTPRASAACTNSAAENRAPVREITSVGTYQPFPYLLPAAALRLDRHAGGSLRLARLATVAMWLALLAIAVYALWDRALGAASLGGLLVALTPMVVFLGASLNGSGLEVIGSIAFFATLLALTRSPDQDPGGGRHGGQDHDHDHEGRQARLLALAGAAGLALALSRSSSPLWLILDALLAALALDRRRARALLTGPRRRRAACAAGACVLAGLALNRLWEALYGPHADISLLPGAANLRAGLSSMIHSQAGLVGNFGYLNVKPPLELTVAWWLLAVALVLAGLRFGARRHRRALLAAVVLAVLAPFYLDAALLHNTGFDLQARHYLPFAAVLPILAFEALRRRAGACARTGPLFTALAAGTAVMQVVAWWFNARRYAVGANGPLWFLDSAQWSPPLGWVPWLALLACAGALTIAVTAVGERRSAPVPAVPGH